MTILAIIILVLTGEALIFGEEIAARSFPTFEQPQSSGILGALDALLAVIQGVWGAIVFFFNLVTFNVPDAPFWVRIPAGAILGGGLVWSISQLFRGN